LAVLLQSMNGFLTFFLINIEILILFVIYLSRTPNSKHTKEPDTSQSYEKNSTSKLNKGQDTS
jgi:hypothetical protein